MMELLNSQDISYVMTLSYIAQAAYNCNKSRECGPYSSFMMSQCMANEEYCGLKDYNEYIELYFSPGIQADIANLVKYIENLFESPESFQ